MEELTKVSHKLAEEIYKQAAAKQQAQNQKPENGEQSTEEGMKEKKSPAGESAAGGKEEDIIDAEYKEEDPNGKK